MAAYQTQQINVGSIAAPDVGSVFANFADRINKQQSNQLDNMRQAAQYDRQQVLNQRADQEWNRQQGVYKAKADVAADFATNPFADKYTGQNKVNNDAVVNAYVKYVENGGEMTDDLNKRVQALTEQNRGFQEDATPAIAQELVRRSNGAISMTDAMNEAKGIAMGLPSRVAQQELADKETKRQQEYQDLIAKNNLDKFKMQADIAKDNQEGRYKDAELKFKQFQAMYGGGSGGSGGSGHGPSSYMDASTFLDSAGLSPYGTGWAPGSDKSDAYAAMNANKADNVPAQVTIQALKNSIFTDPRGSSFDINKFKAETDRLKSVYVDPKTIGGSYKEIQAPTDEQWQSTVPRYVDRNIIGATPSTAEARARLVVPELFRGDPTKVQEQTIVNNPIEAKKGYEGTVKHIESFGGNYGAVNTESGALGAYQFMPKTLDVYRAKNGNFTNEQFLKDPALQDKVFKQFTQANENTLINNGIEVTDYTKWLAHNLGAGNAIRFVRGEQTPRLTAAIEAQLGKGKGTIAEYKARFDKEFKPVNTNDYSARDAILKQIGGEVSQPEEGPKPVPITAAEAPSKQVVKPGWQYLADIMGRGVQDTYNQGKSAVQMIVGPAYDALTKATSPKTEAALALANNTAAGLSQIITSPYNVMKHGTDWLFFGQNKGSWFDKNAENARENAINKLEAAGVTNPATQQVLMLGSDMLAPGGVWKEVKYLKNGINLAKDVDYAKVYKDAVVRPRQNAHFNRSLREESEDLENAAINKSRQEAEDLAAKDAEEEALWSRYKADQKAKERSDAARRSANKRDIEDEAPLRQAEREEILKTRNTPGANAVQKARAEGVLKSKLDAIEEKRVGDIQRLQEGNAEARKFALDYWKDTVAKYRDGKIDDKELERIMTGLNDAGKVDTNTLMTILRGF